MKKDYVDEAYTSEGRVGGWRYTNHKACTLPGFIKTKDIYVGGAGS